MEALLLLAGAFLMWTGYCVIAQVTGYSPEESARRRIEECREMLSEREDRLRRIKETARTSQEKKEVKDLEEETEALRQNKELL